MQVQKSLPSQKSEKTTTLYYPQCQLRGTSIFQRASDWTRRQIRSWRIYQKISYGYGLAIGLAVFGTAAGMAIGDYYQKQAKEELKNLNEQHNLLSQLKNGTLQAQLHQQRLAFVVGNSVWMRYETLEFDRNIANVDSLLLKIKYFSDNHPNILAANKSELIDLLKDYERTSKHYAQLVKFVLKEIDPYSVKPGNIEEAKQVLIRTLGGEVGMAFDDLGDRLIRLIDVAQMQEKHAEATLEGAEKLRYWIILSSMLLSAAIAAVLAFYTSHAIARPIEAVTEVAQRVTKESNFNLQAPVTTEDEVGSLAASLNELIQRISAYTLELKQTQAQLIQTEKMSGLGQTVAGVAHEINNPINFIYGNLEHAKNYTQDLLQLIEIYQREYPNPSLKVQKQIEEIELDFITEDLEKLFSSMKMGADRIRKIVLSLRKFSHLEESEMKTVEIHEGIDSTLAVLSHKLKNIEIIKNYGNLPSIECYPAHLNQAFMNIFVNAVDALLSEAEKENKKITIVTKIIANKHILVRISDNGPGILPEITNKIFDPFFTTKPVGQGTGLGLYICYQIIEKHKGKIEVKSNLGQGTEVAISLPIKAQVGKVPVKAYARI